MPCECASNFDQWKTFSGNYKAMRGLVYKFTENKCHLQLFFGFIQTQKMYPTSFNKISTLAWKLLLISTQNFPSKLNSQRTHSIENYLTSVAAALTAK